MHALRLYWIHVLSALDAIPFFILWNPFYGGVALGAFWIILPAVWAIIILVFWDPIHLASACGAWIHDNHELN